MQEKQSEHLSFGLRMAQFSIHHPVTVCMVFASFIVLGLVSLTRIPIVLTPDVNFPFVDVSIPYPNATPGQVQESITKPVEEALATIPNVQRLNARSSANGSNVFIALDWGQDVDWLRAEVREKIDQIRNELPSDVDRILVQNFGTNDEPIIGGRIASHSRDLRNAYDFLETKLKRPIERLPGVADMQLYGALRKEVDIYLRLEDIKRHRIDVGALFRRLDSANLNFSLGKVVDPDRRYGAITRGVLKSVEDIQRFPVNDRGMRLDQIADIYFDKPITNQGRHLNGEYAVMFEIKKNSSANTVETVEGVVAKFEELKKDPALQGLDLSIWWNSGKEIMKSIRGLLEAGTIGAVLAVVVLFLYLRRLGPTLIIGLSIPFCVIAAIGFLYLLGKTLNVLSMMGLMLACGMLVDNAVVVLESIYQNLEKGKDRVAAAMTGTKEVVSAVVAATMTSIIIFVPLVFGKKTNYSIWLSDTATSIMISLLCSLFFSLTVIPLAVAKLLKTDVRRTSRIDEWLERNVWRRSRVLWSRLLRKKTELQPRLMIDRYLSAVGWSLRHPFVVGFLVVPLVVGTAFFQLKKIPDNSPEAQDLQDLTIQYEFSENFHYVKIEHDYVKPVEKFLLGNKDRFKIKDVMSWYENNEAGTRVFFDKDKITLEELKRIRADMAKQLPVVPGADIKLGRQEGAESQTWIGVNFNGEDSATLQGLAREARNRLRQRPGFVEIHTDADRGKEEVQIRLNRDLAKKYNISAQSLGNTLGIVVRGRQIRGFRTPEGEVDLYMRLQASDRSDLRDLRSIVVGAGPDGREIDLEQIADLRIIKTPGVIQREERRTFQWMWVNYSGDKKDEGKKIISEVLNGMTYPQGYGWSYGFWTQRRDQEDNDFLFNILMALFMVYFVMASIFESISHPFSIMLSLPFALVGVVWMLLLTGTPNNLMAKIGLMVLVGVVVNNGIVLIDHVNNLRRAGVARVDAVLLGCRERYRPILMTASTTVLGMLPLALGTSGVFELRYFPLARTVMGGLISSTVLTLIVLPTYYVLFDDLAQWMRRIWHRSSAAPSEEAPAFGD
jgi:HAE1 family hydrophobic/amphiphilic exporter-1